MKFKKLVKADDITFSNSIEDLKEDERMFNDLYNHLTKFIKYQEGRVTSPSGSIMPEDKLFIDKLKDIKSDIYSFLVNLEYGD